MATRAYRERDCEKCGNPYAPTSGIQRVCIPCGAGRQMIRGRRGSARSPWLREQESITCRRCGAEPGQQCVTTAATFAMRPHRERYYDAGGAAVMDGRRERKMTARRANKRRVLEHYGTSCACCGTTEHLAIDHVKGDGKRHREEIGATSQALYVWLIKNNFPAGFQTLCTSCNNSKKDGDRCRLIHDVCPACHRPLEPGVAAHRSRRRKPSGRAA